MKACVLIPVYNEASTVGRIVAELKKKGLEVIVIDDGSTDDTHKVAAENGAMVLRHNRNIGKGASLKHGFAFILENMRFEAVILMDGDGQHDPNDIDKFIEAAEKEDVELIIGDRMHKPLNMPYRRFVANKVMSMLLSALSGKRIPDTQCGFRLVKRNLLERVKFDAVKYDIESEMVIKASKLGFTISSVPIKTIYRGEYSGIRPFRDTLNFILLLVRSYFK